MIKVFAFLKLALKYVSAISSFADKVVPSTEELIEDIKRIKDDGGEK